MKISITKAKKKVPFFEEEKEKILSPSNVESLPSEPV
jgi:hypothetical protein